jgi:hypothetical protein
MLRQAQRACFDRLSAHFRSTNSGRIGVAPQISGFDPGLASVRPAYPSPPFAAFAYPIVQGPRCSPGCHFNLDRWSYLSPLLWCSLPVLVVDDIHVHCHPACFVLSQIDSAPAHHAPVVDAPPPAADVSRLKPHSSIRTRMRLITHPSNPRRHKPRSIRKSPWLALVGKRVMFVRHDPATVLLAQPNRQAQPIIGVAG